MEHKKTAHQKTDEHKGPNMVHDGEILALISEAAYGLYVKSGFIHGNDQNREVGCAKTCAGRYRGGKRIGPVAQRKVGTGNF